MCRFSGRSGNRKWHPGFAADVSDQAVPITAGQTKASIHPSFESCRMTRRLEPKEYARLRNEVFQRDGWRCQWCGSASEVEVHHLVYRSHGGTDSAENLIA